MSEFDYLLNAFPEAALLIRQDRIAAANPMALHYLPQLAPEGPLPEELSLSPQLRDGAGTFTVSLVRYQFSLRDIGESGTLLLFHPAPQDTLTDGQLDGVLRQTRQTLQDILSAVDGQPQPLPSLPKSCYQMYRLLDNLELLRTAGTPIFRPISMDLVGLCRQTMEEAAAVLEGLGVSPRFDSPLSSLIVSGDPQLLRRMLLELISNAVRAGARGTIRLTLKKQGRRAALSLSADGVAATQRQLCSMLQQDSSQSIPAPESGAGLGLSVVRRVLDLHGGAMLAELGQSSLFLFLPIGAPETLPQEQPPIPLQTDGGLSPLLAALADVLPADLFRLDDLG